MPGAGKSASPSASGAVDALGDAGREVHAQVVVGRRGARRQGEEGRDRARLQQPDPAVPVDGPLRVLRRPVVRLDPRPQLRQGADLRVGEGELVSRQRRALPVRVPPPGTATIATRLSPRRRSRISPVAVSTTKWSGLTAPETTASPRPRLASMTAWRRLPVTGFAVNRTPETSASTIRCTTTARRTAWGSMPLVAR